MKLRITMLVVCTLASAGCESDSLRNLKSPDPQIRCEAFQELFGSFEGPGEKQSRKILYGKSTNEIYTLLGEPTSMGVLEYQGVTWLEAVYRFEVCPKGGEDAWKRGFRYAPSVVFRNGVSVPRSTLDDELEVQKYQILPEHLRFHEGGKFP